MAYPIPKIVYGTTTLTFSFPPVNKSGTQDRIAQRNDSISLSGLKQSLWWRTDKFLNLQMDFVPLADLPAWEDFIDYSLQGGEFSFYPDATLAGFTVYTLDDSSSDTGTVSFTPTRNVVGITKFTLRFRRVIGADQTGS